MTKRSRSDAAKRGWRTRKRREAARRRAAKRRSDAAKRGWLTRRGREVEREKEREPREYDGGVIDDGAFEWEIGFEYRGSDRNSYVDVNIRIAREDGTAMRLAEAKRVFGAMREQLSPGADPIPSGYILSYIDWRRPRWRGESRQGELFDLIQFTNPMYTEKDNDASWTPPEPRYGSVK